MDAQASRCFTGREQPTGRLVTVAVEMRTEPGCKLAQLLVGEIRQYSRGERAEHARSDLIGRRRAGGHDERTLANGKTGAATAAEACAESDITTVDTGCGERCTATVELGCVES